MQMELVHYRMQQVIGNKRTVKAIFFDSDKDVKIHLVTVKPARVKYISIVSVDTKAIITIAIIVPLRV